MQRGAIAGLAVLIAASGGAMAKDKGSEAPPAPAVYQAVIDCSAVGEPQARLACFDRAVAALDTATRDREVVVVDRSTVREAKRGVFGLKLPRIKLFNDDGDEEVQAIDSTITRVRMAKDGMPIFALEDGAQWKQTEGRNVFAKPGQPIHIKRAAMGSFMANVDKQAAVRVIRLAD